MLIPTSVARADNPTSRPASTQPDMPYLTGNWYGYRQTLLDKGITVSLDFQGDYSNTLAGGIDTRNAALRDLFEPTISIDTKPMFNIDGGTIFLDLQQHTGPNASTTLTGDAQGFDYIDGPNRTQIAQLWYEQKWCDGKLRIKAGKVDANSEFQKVDYGQEFLNASMANSPTVVGLPTYPDPSTSVNAFVNLPAGFYAGAGVYDGTTHRGTPTGGLGPATFFRDPRDLFFIAEVGRKWGQDAGQLPGQLAIGGSFSPDRWARFDGGINSQTGSLYAFYEQTIYHPNQTDPTDPKGVGVFLIAGLADPAVAAIDKNLGGGIAWTGPLKGRDKDVLGVGFSAVHFSDQMALPSHDEVAYETFYRLQLNVWLSLKPDLQYITSPAGIHHDALVGTMRVEANF